MSESTFFQECDRFMREHDGCPGGPEHLRYSVWLPRDSDQCSVTLTCICGTRVTLSATRTEGQAVVAASRLQGIPVEESNAAAGMH